VLARLDEWLDGPTEVGWVLVTGGPGMGKSAILAAWLTRREASGGGVPHHFIRRQVADWDQPEVIAASLAAQIEARFPALRDADARPERRLIELLGRVSNQLDAPERLVVVVDGIDETGAEAGDNPLPRFLPHVVPARIRFLCATRPTYPHLDWLEARNPVRRLDLDDPAWTTSNTAVIHAFWEAAASAYQPPLPPGTTAAAIARAEANVLHAVMLHDALQAAPADQRRADRIPRGLKALIGDIWDRAALHPAVRVGLGLLCVAQEALSLDVLAEIAGWSYDDKLRFVRDARQLLLEEPAAWAGGEAYRLRHDWVRELIAERLGPPALRAHHATLARALAMWPAPEDATARRYALRHALIHRADAEDRADAWRIAGDMSFLEAKLRDLGVDDTEADIARVAVRCRAMGDGVYGRRFDDLARALARDSHWLRGAPEAVAALVWNRLRRSGWSTSELDAQLWIMAERAGFLRVRHAATRNSQALVRDLVGHGGRIAACAVTPDGRRVVSASSDGTLRVWDLETGRPLTTMAGHTSDVNACAVTLDGRRVVSASADQTLKIWDLESGRALATLAGHTDSVSACAVIRDGRRMISASWDGTLKVWDLDSGRLLVTLEGHTGLVTACAATADGRHVVSASKDGTLKIWDLESGRPLFTLEGHTGTVTTCMVTPDGQRVVSASQDETLRIWEVESGRSLAVLQGHLGGVNACAVTPDGRRLVSASGDRTLRVWDLESGHSLATLEGHTSLVMACAVAPDGRRVVSGSWDQTLKVWNLDTEGSLAPLDGHTREVNACTVTPDGRRVVSASQDETLKVWDPETGHPLATLEGHTGGVRACAVSSDGRCAVSASWDRTLKLWDLESGRGITTLEGHTRWVDACAVSPDGRRVVSASRDRTLKVWDLESGRLLATLEGHVEHVTACAVTPDGRRVVSASLDRTLKIWNLERGRLLGTLEGHTSGVSACAVTPDGRRVVSASQDRTLRIWDLERGRPLGTLEGHTSAVSACAVTPDGRRVVSASLDWTLKVWDLASCACVLTYRGDGAYTAVAASATTLVAGDSAGGMWFLDWPASITSGVPMVTPATSPQSSWARLRSWWRSRVPSANEPPDR
jgi:WD40 repeat protein